MHPFEENARKELDRQARNLGRILGCDMSFVISLAANQLKELASTIENGRADDSSDIRAARGETENLTQ